ncbi:hypothetical protein [Streptomyces sp. NPDC060010]|uniref:hypothetical protein n=1 Tax=Streptomyces sp. NPDC060010 TaxID=3347036 RepID=UPI00369CE01A
MLLQTLQSRPCSFLAPSLPQVSLEAIAAGSLAGHELRDAGFGLSVVPGTSTSVACDVLDYWSLFGDLRNPWPRIVRAIEEAVADG